LALTCTAGRIHWKNVDGATDNMEKVMRGMERRSVDWKEEWREEWI